VTDSEPTAAPSRRENVLPDAPCTLCALWRAVIRRIAAPCISTSAVTTFAGTIGSFGFSDGAVNAALFPSYSTTLTRGGMMGFSVTPDGKIFVAVSADYDASLHSCCVSAVFTF
jgi:hypothetical protein